ncbi:MAG: 2-hydroxyacyl-CoA dehydratase [Dehalococcoidales bacterium]|nr:2-hydroxyacyl-CoA dehydratase [Dehalococcoidales bacterium]
MEDHLKILIEGNSPANRTTWAREWKRQGRKVIGIMSSLVPEEVVSAAGMLPWRITGTWRENISHARVYRGESSCSYCNHVLESLLDGDLDFLDGIIATDLDQDMLRLWDVLLALKVKPYCYALHVPFVDHELNIQFFRDEIRRLINSLQVFAGVEISDDAIRSSINTYNRMRNLLWRLYELRKKDSPPLSGAEILGITTSAAVMPREVFNNEVQTLFPYLEKRQTALKKLKPRLLVSSEMLENTAYLDLVEEGCLVAMDDMDTGSRYLGQCVDTALEDPAYALARRYLGGNGAPRMYSWDKQAEQFIKWAGDFRIDGVLALPLKWCYPQRYRMPYLSRQLETAGIPCISLEREYHLANTGQLRTRIGAFLEMLESKNRKQS